MTPRPRTLPELLSGLAKVDEVLRSWKLVIDRILACPLLYGVALSGKVPDVGETLVLRHNLGRLPVGWVVTDNTDGGVRIARTAWDESTISFVKETDGSVDAPFGVWVY